MNPASGPVLRDIHLPPAPGWWPLAPGWWVLAALVIIILWLLGRHVRRQLPFKRRWRTANAELDRLLQRQRADGDTAAFAAGVSQLLRRAVRVREAAAISAYGEAWHAALRRHAPDADTAQTLVGLDTAMYRPKAALEIEAVSRAARAWLRHVLLAVKTDGGVCA